MFLVVRESIGCFMSKKRSERVVTLRSSEMREKSVVVSTMYQRNFMNNMEC